MKRRTKKTTVARLVSISLILIASLAGFAGGVMAQTPSKADGCEEMKKMLDEAKVKLDQLEDAVRQLDVARQKWEQQVKDMPWFASYDAIEGRRKFVLARSKLKSRIRDLGDTIDALHELIGEECGSKKPDDTTKPKTPPATKSGTTKGTIDSCLVGTWRADSLVSDVGYKGGAGIVLTIKPDGAETIDYNGMKPIEGNGETHLWRGIVEAYFTTSKGTATVTKADKTDLTVKETYRDGRVSERNTKALGPAALGNYPPDRSYTCDGTTLKFKGVLYTSTFKREKK